MKPAIHLIASLLITTTAFAAPAQKNSAKRGTTSSAQLQQMSTELQELKTMVYQQQHRIDELTQQLQQRDQSLNQVQSSATDAAATATSAQRLATQNADSYSTLRTDVSDLKANVASSVT